MLAHRALSGWSRAEEARRAWRRASRAVAFRAIAVVAIAVLATAGGSAACALQQEPTPGHFVVHLRTDAPVPGDEADGLLPLFDTVRVEIAGEEGPCGGCERDISLDAGALKRGLTFTVRSRLAGPVVVQARMFRAVAPPELAPQATVEVWTKLGMQPRPGEHRDVTITLAVERVGRPSGSAAAPEEASQDSAPLAARPPIWAPARRSPCTAAPSSPREVCIPGGAFWMGSVEANPLFGMSEPRLVVLSPFFLDAHETTVAEYRAGWDPGVTDVSVFSGEVSGNAFEDFCTFTKERGANDAYPVTCIGWSSARLACRARGVGTDLPTEAQWEYVASRFASLPYASGFDVPTCLDAVIDRAPLKSPFGTVGGPCRPAPGANVDPRSAFGWPEPAVRPSYGRDVVQPRGSTDVVVDVMGNVSEWMRDVYQTREEGCWSDPGLRVDPYCAKPAIPERSFLRSIRGGGWVHVGAQANAQLRTSLDATSRTPDWIGIGFRCARAL